MTTDEKASFCAFASVLLAPPEETTLEMLEQDDLRPWLEGHMSRWGADTRLSEDLFEDIDRNDRLKEIVAAYDRLFGQWNGAAISLVESTYKPWSEDRDCGMVFAAATGLLMGDSAVHMNDLYSQGDMDMPASFKGMPDHIVLELEFLSLLYESDSEEKARTFIKNHLDWIDLLKTEIEQAEPHPFYQSAISLLNYFIKEELKTGKADQDGPTKLH